MFFKSASIDENFSSNNSDLNESYASQSFSAEQRGMTMHGLTVLSDFFTVLNAEKQVKATDTQHSLRRMLNSAKIKLSQPLIMHITATGALEIVAEKRYQTAIEALLTRHTAIASQIREMAQYDRFEKLALGAPVSNGCTIRFDFQRDIGESMQEEYAQTVLGVLFQHFSKRKPTIKARPVSTNDDGVYAFI